MRQAYSLAELAEYLEAQYEGDATVTVSAIADLKLANKEQLSFLSNKKFEAYLDSTEAGIVVLALDVKPPKPLNVIRCKDPYLAYAKLSALFVKRVPAQDNIHASAVVAPTAQIAKSAKIGPGCVVEDGATVGEGTELQAGVFVGQNTSVGSDCLIYANVVLYHGVVLGNNVIIHGNTTIGSDGFGFAPTKSGWVKIHQLGGVVIGDNVEIGANTAIDRGAVNNTEIGKGVIIDNQVHIAHNVKIGDYTAIAGCVGIAGSTTIGKHCTFGGQVAINGHITIADNVHVNGGSIVTKSLEAGQYASGTPLQDAKTWRKNAVRQGQLSEWVERIKKLEQTNPSN